MVNVKKQVFIGIDISKNKLDIYNSKTCTYIVIENNARRIGQWLAEVDKQFPEAKFAFEPTGGYEKTLINILLAKKKLAYYVHPNKLLNFKKCHGDKAKTDKIDTFFIADFIQIHPTQLTEINENYFENKRMAELRKAREQLKKQLHAANCFLEHEPYDKVVKQHYKRLIKFLKDELKRMELAIAQVINSNEKMRKIFELLITVKGVGKITAQTMICKMPELGQLGRNQISKLVGVAPINHDSGKQQGQRSIQGGRAEIRSVLYMAALSAIKHNENLKQIYIELRTRAKPFKVAIVAIMRRLLCIMNAMVRDNTSWQNCKELDTQKA